jgi:hypothetical protein
LIPIIYFLNYCSYNTIIHSTFNHCVIGCIDDLCVKCTENVTLRLIDLQLPASCNDSAEHAKHLDNAASAGVHPPTVVAYEVEPETARDRPCLVNVFLRMHEHNLCLWKFFLQGLLHIELIHSHHYYSSYLGQQTESYQRFSKGSIQEQG